MKILKIFLCFFILILSCKTKQNTDDNIFQMKYLDRVWNNYGIQLVIEKKSVIIFISPQCLIKFKTTKSNNKIILKNDYTIDCTSINISSKMDSLLSLNKNKNFATLELKNDSILRINYTNSKIIESLNKINYYADTIFPTTFKIKK